MNRTLVLLVRTLVWGIVAGASALSVSIRPVTPARAGADAAPGVIAFVTSVNGREDQIRLIDPTGANHRLLWSTGDMGVQTPLHYVGNLAWKPDGSELAFHSSHQAACSFYGSDIYGIRSNGTNLRRIASPPACGQNPGLPTGTVKVTYYNTTSNAGPFVVYIEGAASPQSYAIPAYSSLTVTFSNVLDYGSAEQWAVAAWGQYRYISVEGHADVIPGQTVETSVTMDFGYGNWSMHNPTWNFDGTQLAYLFGSDTNPFGLAANNTVPGGLGTHLLTAAGGPTLPLSGGFLTYGPTQAVANQLLYTGYNDGSNIYRATVGQSEPGEILLKDGNLDGYGFRGLAWLPNGSGFLYSMGESFGDVANVFRYSFSTQQSERLTDFSTGWARRLSVAPDGSRVVFEYQSTGDGWDGAPETDLYTMNIDGSDPQLLVAGGRSPAWGPQALSEPVQFNHWLFVPLIRR